MFTQTINNLVSVNRGDTFAIKLKVYKETPTFFPDSEPYHLVEGDHIYLGVTEPHQPFEFALIRKAYDMTNQDADGVMTMDFKPTDTDELIPGKYYYSVKLVTANEEVYTILPKTQFNIID